MNRAARNDAYDDATGWWGPVWAEAVPRSILAMIADGLMETRVAAFLWAHLAQRGSLVVVAGPSGAGKTTLLTSLMELLPEDERRVYLRGIYEPFDFLTDLAVEPTQTVLLANEISPHLPLYLWGPAVRRFLACSQRGFRVLATAHASAAQELVGELAGYPLRIPAPEIAALQLVVVLRAWRADGGIRRRLVELTGLQASERGGIALHSILRPGSQTLDEEAAAAWLWESGQPSLDTDGDLARRAAALEGLREDGAAAGGSEMSIPARLAIAMGHSLGGLT